MFPYGMIFIACLFGLLALLVKPLGGYMARVYSGEATLAMRGVGGLERLIYKWMSVDAEHEMNWKTYAMSMLLFSLLGFSLLFSLLMLQGSLPLNPQALAGLSPDLAFNVAISFITNTNWQSYAGEGTMSMLAQMGGLTVQNFLSASTGMAVAVALFRGLARKQTALLGNFWVDVTRGILYILLPLSIVFALLLASQGVVQSFKPPVAYTPLEQVDGQRQIVLGPVASQIAIKQLGSNGGGYFNANAAHPFENPNAFTNIIELLAVLLIPAAMAYSFGVMVGDRRQGWMLLAAMTVIFVPLMVWGASQEVEGNPLLPPLGIEQSLMHNQPGGNMEGKELRFGVVPSSVWAAATTATSNGSVNAMHDSFTPLGGLVPLLMMQFGEVIYGGVGCGVYGMLIFVLFTVFIGGLMVGRTPEFLGKKIGSFEIKMAMLFILIPAFCILGGTALAVLTQAGRAGMLNTGAQGFSEILYAVTSAGNNNGSAFAGLSANTPFYNILLGIIMFLCRFWLMVPVLAIAGSLALKNTVPQSSGTLPTHTPLFTTMLIGVVIMIGVLTYIPALALGPVAEHLHLQHLSMGGKQ